MKVPVVIWTDGNELSHQVICVERHVGDDGSLSFRFHDVAYGSTTWVTAEQIANEALPFRAGNKIVQIDRPSTYVAPRPTVDMSAQPAPDTDDAVATSPEGQAEIDANAEARRRGEPPTVTGQTPVGATDQQRPRDPRPDEQVGNRGEPYADPRVAGRGPIEYVDRSQLASTSDLAPRSSWAQVVAEQDQTAAKEALEMCIVAWSAALDGLQPGTQVPTARLADLDRSLDLHTTGFHELVDWMIAMRMCISSAETLDAAIQFLLRTRTTWVLTDVMRSAMPTAGN